MTFKAELMRQLTSPSNKQEKQQYLHFRWQHLRAPWQQPQGSELDNLEEVSHHFMITDKDNHIIAVARLHQVNQTLGQVRYVAVSPAYQGQGLGRQIMAACEQRAGELGLHKIELNARENALAFYLSQGYTNQGKSHVLYDEIQHYKMEKVLPESVLTSAVQELVKTWYATIPMSKAMGIRVLSATKDKLMTSCDLAFNKNLHNTMFAGSINTLATLTGWGWVNLQLEQQGLSGDIVLGKGSIKYLAPIPAHAYAVVDQTNVEEDYQNVAKNKKAKVHIICQVYSGDILAAEFTGTYVVIPKKGEE